MYLTRLISRIQQYFRGRPAHPQRRDRHLRLMKLEDRRVLNATFSFDAGAGVLSIANIDSSGLTVREANLDATGLPGLPDGDADVIVFDLSDGSWSGPDNVDGLGVMQADGDAALELVVLKEKFQSGVATEISITSSSSLTVTFAAVDLTDVSSGVMLTGVDTVTQSGAIEAESLTIIDSNTIDLGNTSNSFDATVINSGDLNSVELHTTERSIDISVGGNLTISGSGVVIHDAGVGAPLDPDVDIRIDATGSITVGGVIANNSDHADADIVLTAVGADSDIQVNESITAQEGDVILEADDSIFLTDDGDIVAFDGGQVSLTANSDDAAAPDGSDEILMGSGSSINSGSGRIVLSAVGADGGNITLTQLTTTRAAADAVLVETSSDIIDGLSGESANITALGGTITLNAVNGSIGQASDIDINAVNLIFVASPTSSGVVQITDLSGGLSVSGASRAGGGGSLVANSPLTISADISVGASMTFTAGNSGAAGDNLTIDNNAVVQLTSAVAETLTFEAGDSIVFNTGRIVTAGGGVHTVELLADLEGGGGGDADRGAITQDGNATAEVTTDDLVAEAGAGIDLDVAVVTLTAENTASGTIDISEVAAGGDIAILTVDNDTRNVSITSLAGAISDGNAAALNISAGTLLLAAVNGIGSGNALEASITQLEATNTTAGTIEITDTAAGLALGQVSNGTRDVQILASGAITDGNGAALNVTAGTLILTANSGIGSGNAIETNITRLDAANAGSGAIEITEVAAGAGIALGLISNPGRAVTIVAIAGAITDANGLAVNLIADTVGLSATTGIGSGDAIETQIALLNASNTISGTIEIIEVISGGDLALGVVDNGTRNVTIESSSGEITDGNGNLVNIFAGTATLTAISGIGAQNALETNITLLNAFTSDDGAIQITEVAAGGDLAIGLVDANNDNVRIESVAGSILDGDTGLDDLDVVGENVSLIALNGSIGASTRDVFKAVVDAIEVQARGNLLANAPTGIVALDALVFGSTTIIAGATILESDGDLDATGIIFTTNSVALIADADRNGTGVLTIGTSLTVAGDLRLEGADIVATDGIFQFNPVLSADRLLVRSGTSEQLTVTVNALDVTTFGSMTVTSTASVNLLDLNCDNVALQSTDSSGNVIVLANGTVTVTDDVIAGNDGTTTSTGGILLRADGATSDIVVNDTVLTDRGVIFLVAANDIRFVTTNNPVDIPGPSAGADNNVTVTTIDGNILIQADFDGDANGAGGGVTMADGTRVIAGRSDASDYVPGIDGEPSPTPITLGTVVKGAGFAQINVIADESIVIGSLQCMNSTGNAVRVTSGSGAVSDAGDLDVDIVANVPGAVVTISAVTGIGSGNALETALSQLEATNTTAGTIEITEVAAGQDIALGSVNNGTRDVTITTQAGEITDANGATLNLTGGTVTLIAVNGIGSTDALETDITQLNATNSSLGNIAVTEVAAGLDIALGSVDNGGRDVDIRSSAGAITDANGAGLNITGGQVILVATSGIGSGDAVETNLAELVAVNQTSGMIEIVEIAAGGDLGLSFVDNDTRDVAITSTAGGLVDANGAAVNLIAGTATLTALNGIGSGDALETSIARLEASNTGLGAIEITELAAGLDIALGTVFNGTRDVIISALGGAITDGNAAALNLTGGTVTLNAVNGIGSGDALETSLVQLAATNTGSGRIEIREEATGLDISLLAVSNDTREVVITAVAGAIADGNAAGTNITAGIVTLNAQNGIGNGNSLETDVTQLAAANSTAGTIEITEILSAGDILLGAVLNGSRNILITSVGGGILDGNAAGANLVAGTAILSAVAGIGSGDALETEITLLEAANTVAGTIEVVELAPGGDIALGTVANGDRDILLTSAAGAISDGNASALNLVGGTVTLNAVSGIGNGDALETEIVRLEALNSAAGTIEITEISTGLDLGLGIIANGSRGVIIESEAGAIADANGSVLNIQAGAVVLTAAAGIGSGDALETDIGQLDAFNTTTGTVEISEVVTGLEIALGSVVNGSRDIVISAAGGQIRDANAGASNLVGGIVTLTAAGGIGSGDALETEIVRLEVVNTVAGTIEITEVVTGGDLALGLADNQTRDVQIAVEAGAITDGNAADLNISGGLVTLTATGGIGSGDAIETSIATLSASNTLAGSIEVTEVAGGGDLALAAVSNGLRDVAIASAAGAITDFNGAAGNVTAGALTLIAVNGIGDGDPIETAVVALTAVNSGSGDIRILEADSVALDTLDNGARTIVFTAGGAITDGGDTRVDIVGGAVQLTAAGGIGGLAAGAELEITVATLEAANTVAGDISIRETDSLTIGGSGVRNQVNDASIRIIAENDLRVTGDVVAGTSLVDGTGDPTGESIELRTIAGDVAIGSIVISTDEDLTPLASSDETPDRIVIQAGALNTGAVSFGIGVQIRTDGGVARQFVSRPVVGMAGTAFFTDGTGMIDPTVLNAAIGVDYLTVYVIQVGVAGEENLRLQIDWRDPFLDTVSPTLGPENGIVDAPVESGRIQTFLVDSGVRTIGHLYTFNDFRVFVTSGVTAFEIDFSVSHHESISVTGSSVAQGGPPEPVPGGNISSTDNADTPAPPLPPEGSVDVTDDVDSNRDFWFEGGTLRIRIPTIILPPVEPVVDPPKPAPAPVAIAPPKLPVPLVVVPESLLEFPYSSYTTQSQDIFQLRRSDGVTLRVQPGFEEIKEERGELLLQPDRLKEWIREHRFQDGLGFELWLITTKVNAQGDLIKIERPVLKFDIADERPFPKSETLPDEFPEMKLEELPLEESSEGAGLEIPGMELPGGLTPLSLRTDVRDTEDGAAGENSEASHLPADGKAESESLIEGDDVSSLESEILQPTMPGRAAQSALAGLALTSLLSGRRRPGGVPSPASVRLGRLRQMAE